MDALGVGMQEIDIWEVEHGTGVCHAAWLLLALPVKGLSMLEQYQHT